MSDHDSEMQSSPARPAAASSSSPHATAAAAASSAAASSSGAAAAPAPSDSASSSAAPAAAAAAAPKGILKHKANRKRRSLVWNEANLDSNEVERIERGPRMKIDEPKTPYQQPQSHRSPEALQLDGQSGSEPLSPLSTTASPGAGAPPSELNLGDRLMDISNEALQRREHQFEDDDEDDEGDDDHGGADPSSSSAAAAAAAPSSLAHARHTPAAIETGASSADNSGAETPEHKHQVFEMKKKANYSHMGDLLKSGRNKDAIAARLAEANKRLHDED